MTRSSPRTQRRGETLEVSGTNRAARSSRLQGSAEIETELQVARRAVETLKEDTSPRGRCVAVEVIAAHGASGAQRLTPRMG
jgi:hypothetical protein